LEKELTDLPNIGKTLAVKLKAAGIKTSSDLERAGSEDAFIKIKTIDRGACIDMLYALEGAIQGIRWHDLDESSKSRLKDFFRQLK
jgi:DNA transformation protein